MEKVKKISDIVFKAVENSDVFCVVTDDKGEILYLNNGALKITGYPEEKLIGNVIYLILINASDIEEFLNTGKIFKGFIQGKKSSGETFYLYSEIYPIKENNKLKGFVYLGEKILEKEKLEKFSTGEEFDIVTGIPHEKAFSTIIATHIKRYNEPFSLMVINICGFADIALTYGQEFSETLLKEVGERIKTLLPYKSFIGKTASDAFLIVFWGSSKQETGFFITEIFEHFCKPFIIGEKSIIITVNIGISSFPEDGKTFNELLNKANIALLRAKKQGENTFSIYEEKLEREIRNSVSQKEKLAEILKERRFLLFVQPYYLASTKEVSGAEVLLRIKNNENIESIANVIDFLEASGLILKVEDYLFDEIKKIGPKIKIPLSINISAKSFVSSEIFSKLADLRKTLGYPFACEITERLFLEKNVLEIIKKIKELDIKIAIDDFGTGYSSFSYIENFPVDIIKIDIGFVRRMLDEPKALAIVQTIIDIGKRLGIKTLAEGVENKEQFRILRLLMCDYVQGYYLSKPFPIESLVM